MYNHNESRFNWHNHDFIKRGLFPANQADLDREERHYQETLSSLREEAQAEQEFLLKKRELTRIERRVAVERI